MQWQAWGARRAWGGPTEADGKAPSRHLCQGASWLAQPERRAVCRAAAGDASCHESQLLVIWHCFVHTNDLRDLTVPVHDTLLKIDERSSHVYCHSSAEILRGSCVLIPEQYVYGVCTSTCVCLPSSCSPSALQHTS